MENHNSSSSSSSEEQQPNRVEYNNKERYNNEENYYTRPLHFLEDAAAVVMNEERNIQKPWMNRDNEEQRWKENRSREQAWKNTQNEEQRWENMQNREQRWENTKMNKEQALQEDAVSSTHTHTHVHTQGVKAVPTNVCKMQLSETAVSEMRLNPCQMQLDTHNANEMKCSTKNASEMHSNAPKMHCSNLNTPEIQSSAGEMHSNIQPAPKMHSNNPEIHSNTHNTTELHSNNLEIHSHPQTACEMHSNALSASEMHSNTPSPSKFIPLVLLTEGNSFSTHFHTPQSSFSPTHTHTHSFSPIQREKELFSPVNESVSPQHSSKCSFTPAQKESSFSPQRRSFSPTNANKYSFSPLNESFLHREREKESFSPQRQTYSPTLTPKSTDSPTCAHTHSISPTHAHKCTHKRSHSPTPSPPSHPFFGSFSPSDSCSSSSSCSSSCSLPQRKGRTRWKRRTKVQKHRLVHCSSSPENAEQDQHTLTRTDSQNTHTHAHTDIQNTHMHTHAHKDSQNTHAQAHTHSQNTHTHTHMHTHAHTEYTHENAQPNCWGFTGRPGLKNMNVDRPKTPLQYFQLFFTRELLKYIAIETNIHAEQVATCAKRCNDATRCNDCATTMTTASTNMHSEHVSARTTARCKNNATTRSNDSWVMCNETDIAKFIGLSFFMGILRFPTLRHYWNTDRLYSHSLFTNTMSGKRYREILRYFRCYNCRAIANNSQDCIAEVRAIMTYLSERFRACYEPNERLLLEERSFKWQKNVSFRPCRPAAMHKYALKVYTLAEADSGYIHGFDMFSGSLRTSQDAICNLLEPLFHKGYKVYVDEYCNSVSLCERMYTNGVYMCGALRDTPKEIHERMQDAPSHEHTSTDTHTSLSFDSHTHTNAHRLSLHTDSSAHTSKTHTDAHTVTAYRGNVLLLTWKDSEIFNMASTFHSDETILKNRRNRVKGRDGRYRDAFRHVRKPLMIDDYEQQMSCNRYFDQLMQYYDHRRTQTWTKKVAFFFFKMALHNGYVLYSKYTHDKRKLSLLQYMENIITNLIEFSPEEWPNSGFGLQHAADLPAHSQVHTTACGAQTEHMCPHSGHARVQDTRLEQQMHTHTSPIPNMSQKMQILSSTSTTKSHAQIPTSVQSQSPSISDTPLVFGGPYMAQAAQTGLSTAALFMHAASLVPGSPLGSSLVCTMSPNMTSNVLSKSTTRTTNIFDNSQAGPSCAHRVETCVRGHNPCVDPSEVQTRMSQVEAEKTRKIKKKRYVDAGRRLDLSLGHMISRIPSKRRLRCRVCLVRESRRRDTVYECTVCDVPLCLKECFARYHTQRDLKA